MRGLRQVTVIGHGQQLAQTVSFLAEGGLQVRLYTNDEAMADTVAHANVRAQVVDDDYAAAPANLAGPPYIIGLDDEAAARVRTWLPPIRSVFLVGNDRRSKVAANLLPLMPSAAHYRRVMLRRLATVRRVDALLDLARGAKRPLILMYADPDPDAVGAALGLATLWRTVGAQPAIRYTGEIHRFQNKLLLTYLREDIDQLHDDELAQSDLIAVVDAQPGFWKDAPPPARVVIDHHPVRPDTQAEFVDLRPLYGSTSTILTEYLVEADIAINRRLATALLYGLASDTDDLQRHASGADIKAYDALLPRADRSFLARLNKSQVPMDMLDWIAWGISHRVVFDDLIVIHFGVVPTPDVMVQSADLALLTAGITWVVCAGVHDDRLTVIFRGDGHRQDVGKRAASAFARIGSAGGHKTMGRAEIPLRGEHVDATVDLLIDNLFKRMSPARRGQFIRILRNHLHGPAPADPAAMQFPPAKG
ncbi:MAG TPA: DHH family phosphoesterase [Planctomycetota bacterium]|nr:DHH family phosphoesterase [Planctomycetota bacterium]